MFITDKRTGFSNIETLTSVSISLIICLICVYSVRYYFILEQKIKDLKIYHNFLTEINNQIILKHKSLSKLSFDKIDKPLSVKTQITKPYGKNSQLNKIFIKLHIRKNVFKTITLFKIKN